LLKASQQRTVLILDLRQQIGYEGISQLAVGCWLLAVGCWQKKEKKFCLLPSSSFLLPSSLFPLPSSFFLTSVTSVTSVTESVAELPSSFSMIPVILTIPVVQLASGDRLSLQVYQFQGAVPETKGYV